MLTGAKVSGGDPFGSETATGVWREPGGGPTSLPNAMVGDGLNGST